MTLILENPAAADAYNNGLRFVLDDDFFAAHKSFEAARQSVQEDMQSFDVYKSFERIQLAQIDRTDGFTYARESVQKERPQMLIRAFLLTKQAELSLAPLINDQEDFNPEGWEYFMSENGKTISSLFRLAVINDDMFKSNVLQLEPRKYQAAAWPWLVEGSNHGYAFSHAIDASYYEKFLGHKIDTAHWLGRAVIQLTKISANSNGNFGFKPALQSLVSNMQNLASAPSPSQAVVKNP